MSYESWGHCLTWDCGHSAYVLDLNHDLTHPHWCPECDGRKECRVEYLDIHVSWAGLG